jgi:putative peptidoglycan lipid II flippase
MALVAAGGAVYAVACLLTGAFRLDDLKLIMKRTRQA